MTAIETPAFIDFEASSLDLVASYPIEVGVCLPDGRINSWLIKPHVIWREWSESAEQIHGISREQLDQEGEDIRIVAQHLNTLLPEHVFCDAWTFDSFWLHRLYRTAGMQPTFQLESVSALLAPHEVEQWASIRQEVIQTLQLDTHRAANDARILRETWLRVVSAQSPRRALSG